MVADNFVSLVIFNSLCVLFGAMGLRKDDLSSVLPDVAKAKSVVHQGFGNIHNMASRGGGKVAQSERFLKRLMKATLRRGQKVSDNSTCATAY